MQSVVSPDNCYSELYAINASLNKTLAIRNLMLELNMITVDQIKINMYVDNKASKTIVETHLGSNSKHYNINLLYARDFIQRNELKLTYIKSNNNLADLYTKVVQNQLFYTFRAELNIVNNHIRKSKRIDQLNK